MDTPQTNITRAMEALSPYLNSPRRTVIRIEVFVGLAATLLFVQLILGPFRRRSGHWFIQGVLWLSYTFSFPLITYTIGQMVSSPIKNALYPLWAIFLFWAAGCTNSMTVYAVEDNKQWKRYLFDLFQYYVYTAFIFQLLINTPDTSVPLSDRMKIAPPPLLIALTFLVVLLLCTNLVRVASSWKVTNPIFSKMVADYMRDQVDDRQEAFDPVTLKGCRYIVKIYPKKILFKSDSATMAMVGKGPTYRRELPQCDIVTINTIWEHKFDDRNGGGSRLRDACLSLALYHLLKRRFYGMESAEADVPETRNFVLRGLIKQDDDNKHNNYTRAFQIIEVELGFLYDFFFTKYAVLAAIEDGFLTISLLKLIYLSICGTCLLRPGSFIIRRSKPVIEVGTTTVDVSITMVIIGALWIVETLQLILYLTSDWATVSLACSYTRKGTWFRKLILSVISCLRRFNLSKTKFGKFLDRHNLFGYWQNKMGQSYVIEGCNPGKYGIPWPMHIKKTFVPVPDLIKSEIVSCLQKHSKNGGCLTNGRTSLMHIRKEFSDTLSEDQSQTMIMLIWHIATEYCNIASSNEAQSDPHRDTATKLSRYCAYLMSFVPELLPGNSTDTAFVSKVVLLEAKKLLPNTGPITKEILMQVINPASRNSPGQNPSGTNYEDGIFMKGLRLGVELEKEGVGRWKVLAEFWAETIIFIAPSDNVTAHVERLAQGGEFLTHVWALLNHAGILRRDQILAPENMAQP